MASGISRSRSGAGCAALATARARPYVPVDSLLTSLHATPDATFLLFEAEGRAGTRDDVSWRVPTSGNASPSIVLGFRFNEGMAEVSAGWPLNSVRSTNGAGVDEVSISRWTAATATAGNRQPPCRAAEPRHRDGGRNCSTNQRPGVSSGVTVSGEGVRRAGCVVRCAGPCPPTGRLPMMVGASLWLCQDSQGAAVPFTVVLNWQSALR